MFAKTNAELDLAGLDDFIEKPSQNCDEVEIKNGVEKILTVLNKNPIAVINIIARHPFISASFLLEDLAVKMRKQNCLEDLRILFDKCLDELVEVSIYNLNDLERCVKVIPTYSERMIENILSHQGRSMRILEADKNPEETLKVIAEKYSNYKNQFSNHYNAMNVYKKLN